jgi:hypothetical protein
MTLDPEAAILPYSTPHPSCKPIFLVPGTYRKLYIDFDRATPSIRKTLVQILELADPSLTQQDYSIPEVSFTVRGGMQGIAEFVTDVSDSPHCLHRSDASLHLFGAAPIHSAKESCTRLQHHSENSSRGHARIQ